MSEYTAVVRWIPQMIAAKGSGRPIEPLPPVCLQRFWVKAEQPEAQPTEPTGAANFDKLISWFCATLTTEQLATINALVLSALDDIAPYNDDAPMSPIEHALVDLGTTIEGQLQHRTQTISERATQTAKEIAITLGVPQEQAFLLPVYRIVSQQLAPQAQPSEGMHFANAVFGIPTPIALSDSQPKRLTATEQLITRQAQSCQAARCAATAS